MPAYNHNAIESKWQKRWEDEGVFAASDTPKPGKKKYVLDMFPYPSGAGLHVGHPEGYTATDIYCRYLRMRGYEVLHPMGWDAFGLPAENYAIKSGVHPDESTRNNIKTFTRQIKSLGFSYDWPREVNTSSPDYYRWTQWLFLQLYNAGLAYKKQAPVNWCPDCQTVLANEQVVDGKCDRCGTVVVQKNLEQWFFKITGAGKGGSFPERLLNNLAKLDWPEPIKTMQRNWIGRSEGAEIDFPIVIAREGTPDRGNPVTIHGIASSATPSRNDIKIGVFTTRPDTLFGATYMVLAPEHALVQELKNEIENWSEVEKYIKTASAKSQLERTDLAKEKTGVELKGVKAINPGNSEEIPVWVADYVLAGYGTGAIMAVPGHDERDFAFAKKYNLPIRQVIEPVFIQSTEPGKVVEGLPFEHRDAIIAIVKHWSEDKYIGLKWKDVAWNTFITGGIEKGQTAEEAALMEIREETGYTNAKLITDFGLIHGKFYHIPKKVNCFAHARALYFQLRNDEQEEVSEAEQAKHEPLWLTQEEFKKFLTADSQRHALELLQGRGVYTGGGVMTNSGEFDGMDSEEAKWKITKKVCGKRTIQYKLRDWLISRQRYWGAPIPIIYCDDCGEQAVNEKDLPVELPTDVDFRPKGESPLARSKSFHNVKCPKCGKPARRESDTMDTFVDSSWYFLRYIDPNNQKAFADKKKIKAWMPVDTYVGGAEHAVLHLMYARFITMALHDLSFIEFDEPFLQLRNQGLILGPDGQKMSKSRGNVINPDEVVENLGADCMRMYEMFMGPLEDAKPWDTNGIVGVRRFLERVWNAREFVDTGYLNTEQERAIARELARTVKKVQDDIQSFGFNTAVSAFMIFINTIYKHERIVARHWETFLKILNPFAPHITNELWEMLGRKNVIEKESWPEVDILLLAQDEITYAIQVNGKLRGSVAVAAGSDEAEVAKAAQRDANVAKHVEGREIAKAVFVKDKLVNFVVK